jgi:type I restriction-modification system DNA methylase subunit
MSLKECPTSILSLEKQLWKSADKLRKNIDAAEYKHVVLGLIFLKYISDAFEELYATLKAGEGEYAGADPEDKDEYKAENVFFVPQDARWTHLQAHAKQPTIGKTVDEAINPKTTCLYSAASIFFLSLSADFHSCFSSDSSCASFFFAILSP